MSRTSKIKRHPKQWEPAIKHKRKGWRHGGCNCDWCKNNITKKKKYEADKNPEL